MRSTYSLSLWKSRSQETTDVSTGYSKYSNRVGNTRQAGQRQITVPGRSPETFEVLRVVVLPPSGQPHNADSGVVQALVDVRRGGISLRDCRLIRQYDGTLRLYGPQVRQRIPATNELLFRTLANWSEADAIRMGQIVIEAAL